MKKYLLGLAVLLMGTAVMTKTILRLIFRSTVLALMS